MSILNCQSQGERSVFDSFLRNVSFAKLGQERVRNMLSCVESRSKSDKVLDKWGLLPGRNRRHVCLSSVKGQRASSISSEVLVFEKMSDIGSTRLFKMTRGEFCMSHHTPL